MHSNIKGNKMFFDSAERLKNEISFIEKEKKKYKKWYKGIQMMCECKEDSKEFVMFSNQGFRCWGWYYTFYYIELRILCLDFMTMIKLWQGTFFV